MKISLDLTKNVDKNASIYYDKAKKVKKKIEGAKEALGISLKKLKKLEKQRDDEIKVQEKRKDIKREWYEKFRWFISSEDFLCIGGRDATTNEIIIKKHTENNDLVFHTDMAGSPFFVIKTEGKTPKATLTEVADATVSFSRVWKLGMQTSPVFWVTPDQVSKEPQSGEYLSKGAFMIYGKTNYIDNKINCAIGMLKDGRVMAGPVEAIKVHCKDYMELIQGKERASAVAKLIQKKIGGELDEIIRVLPSGGCKVKK
jgi:predicted ribosome quality control (RQC) complex YloA/Tae2 family protein